MSEKYKKHLKERFRKIDKLQQVFGNEKRIGAELYRYYINSLSSFPQWLTIFTGIIGPFGAFNKNFLFFAFVSFLLASLLILYVKRSAIKKVDDYLNRLDSILEETSNFTYTIANFAMGKINEEEIKQKEQQFEINLDEKRKNLRLEENKGENTLIEISFWLTVFGGLLLVLSMI